MRVAFFAYCTTLHIVWNSIIFLFSRAYKLRADDKSAMRVMIKSFLLFLAYLSSLTSDFISEFTCF